VLIEETFPLACSLNELEELIEVSRKHIAGWIGFYWGKPPDELRRSNTISAAIKRAPGRKLKGCLSAPLPLRCGENIEHLGDARWPEAYLRLA
jgi:hypothetical protein